MSYCDDLIKVHRASGGPSRGQRATETSLNRAVVVLAVAAWQSAVEDMTMSALEAARAVITPPMTPALFGVIAGRVMTDVHRFSTANAQNSRALLQSIGFDPRPHWTWRSRTGQRGATLLKPGDVETRIDEWLKLRHAVAHGDAELPPVRVLLAVRQKKNPPASWTPQIRLIDGESCVWFFRRLTWATGDALAVQLGVPPPVW
jgi:hypothetical protein